MLDPTLCSQGHGLFSRRVELAEGQIGGWESRSPLTATGAHCHPKHGCGHAHNPNPHLNFITLTLAATVPVPVPLTLTLTLLWHQGASYLGSPTAAMYAASPNTGNPKPQPKPKPKAEAKAKAQD